MQKGIDYYYYPSQTASDQQNNPVFSDKSSQPHNKCFYVNNGQNSPSTLSTPNTLGENSSGQEADVDLDALAYDVDDLASRDEAMQQEFEDDAVGEGCQVNCRDATVPSIEAFYCYIFKLFVKK